MATTVSGRPAHLGPRALVMSRPGRWAAIALAAIAADDVFDPANWHVPLCPFRAVTGWWCPLCGGLRSAQALSHVEFSAALHDNLLLIGALPVLAAYWLDWLARTWAGKPRRPIPRAAIVAVLVIGVGFTVVRNLPFAVLLRPN